MIIDLIESIKQRPKQMKLIALIAGVLLVTWSATAVDTSHAHTWAEKIPGFWALFGLFACLAFIFFAKWFGNSGIQTREDYYDK